MIIVENFIKFVESLFPFNPYIHDQTKTAIKQFNFTDKKPNFCSNFQDDTIDLKQGDVIGQIPFVIFEENGNMKRINAKAIILSNSCDIENDDDIIVAPLIDIDMVTKSINKCDIEKNYCTRFLHFPDVKLDKYVIDFSLMHNIRKNFILSLINDKKIEKISTLNQLGYYFFLCKLAVHFMRPESLEINRLID